MIGCFAQDGEDRFMGKAIATAHAYLPCNLLMDKLT
jgi:hypothetical protein